MEKKEKIFIIIITLIILACVFIGFLVSNSAKKPPEVLVQNIDEKTVNAVMGGYEWKVFGTNHIADSVDLKDVEYSIENTIVSKPSETLTISTTEKFIIDDISFISSSSNANIEAEARLNEGNNYFTVPAPELEGTYLCLFELNYYDKGSAKYGVKLVVTDDNIYDVESIITLKNTKFDDVVTIKEIVSKLPYSKNLKGIMSDTLKESKTVIIRYNIDTIQKEDLVNNSIALFALIPEVDNIIYEIESLTLNDTIYYSRVEINDIVSRNVLEYAENSSLWTKEIIYKEREAYNNEITIFTSTIKTMLAKLNEKDLGDYIAIDIEKNSGENESGDTVSLDEYDITKLLTELNKEYELVLNVDSDNFNNKSGTIINIKAQNSGDNEYVIGINLETSNGKRLEETYEALKSGDVVMINPNEINIINVSGE